MPLDTTQIDGQIDANLSTTPPRGITALKLRTVLKNLTAFVKDAVNNNFSIWRKMGGNVVAGANTDNIYHLGKISVGRSDEGGTGAQFSVHEPGTLRQIFAAKSAYSFIGASNTDGQNPSNPINEAGAAQVSIGANTISGSSDLAFVQSNFAGGGFTYWQQRGLDNKNLLAWLTGNGDLLISNTITAPAEKLHVQGNAYIAGLIRFPAAVAQRRLVMYQIAENDHQFFGLGINGNTFRLQLASAGDAFVFYAGTSPVTSDELARLKGSGEMELKSALVAGWRTRAGWPAVGDIPLNKAVLIKDTTSGELRLWANDGGTRKSVLLQNT